MNGTLIYLKTICDQLKEVLGLCDGLNVCAMIDDKEDPHKVLGWCIVRLLPDGHIRPIDSKRYHTIREMIKSMQGERVSEDLEKAIDTYLATYFGGEKEKQGWPFLKKMAIHFAEWQKQKDNIPVSEDLENFVRNYREKYWYPDDIDKFIGFAKQVANWQEQKLMTNAVDGILLEGHLIRQEGITHPLHSGDKVKVIVIKEE